MVHNLFTNSECYSLQAEGYTKLYVSNRVKSNTKVLAYTLLSMIADIGCYVGILLGVAAIDVAAIVERLIEKL